MHVSKNVSYMEDNIVLNSTYQVLNVSLGRMFCIVTNGKYWIIDENVPNNSQDIVLTLGMATSVTNIVA
jgi:predicted type IV restriction endonuclease